MPRRVEDPKWPNKSPPERERQRRAYEHFYEEWRALLNFVKREGRHPSPVLLADLVKRYGVPDFAREYVDRRLTESLPPGRPLPLPRRPTTIEEFDLACATGRYRYHGAIRIVSDGLTLHQYSAVRAVFRRPPRSAAFVPAPSPRRQTPRS